MHGLKVDRSTLIFVPGSPPSLPPHSPWLTVLGERHVVLHKRLKVLPVVLHVPHRLLAQPQVPPGVALQLVAKGTEQAVPAGVRGQRSEWRRGNIYQLKVYIYSEIMYTMGSQPWSCKATEYLRFHFHVALLHSRSIKLVHNTLRLGPGS